MTETDEEIEALVEQARSVIEKKMEEIASGELTPDEMEAYSVLLRKGLTEIARDHPEVRHHISDELLLTVH